MLLRGVILELRSPVENRKLQAGVQSGSVVPSAFYIGGMYVRTGAKGLRVASAAWAQ